MKSYLILFGCLAFIYFAHTWPITNTCPPIPFGCPLFKNATDAQICRSYLVADISYSDDYCGRIRINKLHHGNKKRLSNGRLLTALIDPTCPGFEKIKSEKNLCLSTGKANLDELYFIITLDLDVQFIVGQCDVSHCNGTLPLTIRS